MRLCIAGAGIEQNIFIFRRKKNDYSGKKKISALR